MPPRAKTRRKATSRQAADRSRPAITVEDLADFNDSINLLVHGDSGVGKTPYSAMAPDSVILSTEKGAISAKRYGSKSKLIRATSWMKIEAAVEYLEQNPSEFQWVIVDSLPKMQQLLLRFLLEMNVEEQKAKADLDLPALADHQKWQNMFKRFVDRLIDLPVNCIFIATSMRVEIEDTDGEIHEMVIPGIEGKAKEGYAISQYVSAQMDGVHCLKIVSPKEKGADPFWRLLTQARPPYFAKDRFRALPRVINYPYMPKVIDLIQDSVTDGTPLFDPDLMTMPGDDLPDAKSVRVLDADDADEDEDDFGDEEPEPPRKRSNARNRAAGTRSTRATRTAKSGQKSHGEDDLADEDDEAEEEEPEPPKRRTGRTTRRPARTARQPANRAKRKKADEEDESDDSDDFDPDEFDLED